ncbi:MAG TPA: transcriptional activator RfaH [Phycisphaerae bacterium]|nr:transcriptional activator RfaH [Phycisphaerae bacterium]
MYSAIDIGSSQCHPVSTTGSVQLPPFEMQAGDLAWYCARTKPKHEHFAAAHLRQNLNLEVFHPRLRLERATQRGVVRVVEPLFPCYLFVRCVLEDRINDIQRSNGIHSFVHFGNHIPSVADSIVEELQECFAEDDTMAVSDRIAPGDEVTVGEGAFTGMRAYVLRLMPAKKRIQVLLDILGGPTVVEVNRCSVVSVRNTLADLTPVLAAPSLKMASV